MWHILVGVLPIAFFIILGTLVMRTKGQAAPVAEAVGHAVWTGKSGEAQRLVDELGQNGICAWVESNAEGLAVVHIEEGDLALMQQLRAAKVQGQGA